MKRLMHKNVDHSELKKGDAYYYVHVGGKGRLCCSALARDVLKGLYIKLDFVKTWCSRCDIFTIYLVGTVNTVFSS